MTPSNPPDGTYGAVIDAAARERALLAGASRALTDDRRTDLDYTPLQ